MESKHSPKKLDTLAAAMLERTDLIRQGVDAGYANALFSIRTGDALRNNRPSAIRHFVPGEWPRTMGASRRR
jgi:hypothetical protein